ncbi:MAG: hypothetical protein C5B51_11245 [Terriglobia bacterium]|nr:MAG: hypothetical protein C5B51_11245 [Terriglobia bacterium]
MTITYANGTKREAVLVKRHENTIRAAVKGEDDFVEFKDFNGTWVSEDCEPVQIEFEWQRHERRAEVTEADCVCSQELAARLIQMLLSGEEPESQPELPLDLLLEAAAKRMVV